MRLESNRLVQTRPNPSTPLSQRLRAPVKCEHAWKSFKLDNRSILPVNKMYDLSMMAGGYFAGGYHASLKYDLQINYIDIIELPGLTSNGDLDRETGAEDKEVSLSRWTHDIAGGGLYVIDFTMDPFQDLLVLEAVSPPR